MGVNDNDEAPQTREGASQNASRRPHAHSNAAGGRRRGQAERVTGKRAEVAALQAQLRAARERGDIEQERAAATKLARRWVMAGTRLDQATRLARRSLLLGEDPKLREELSSWFASLGRLALAAGTLEPLLERQLSGPDRARLWTRIAVLRARSSEAEGSAEALNQAAKADPNDPLALELFAAMRGFAPQAVSQSQATDALMQAANLREAAGDERAALEDLLQALNINPGHVPAAERMARHLAGVGRPQAADEVWRRAAGTFGARDERTLTIHQRRIREALDAQLPAVALGAALDLEADRELPKDAIADALDLINDGAGFVPIPAFDGLLHCLGLTDWLIARALRVARRAEPEVCAELMLRAGQVLAGPLGQREQLPWLFGECLLRNPGADAVCDALLEHARATNDVSSWVDAIVALGRTRMDHPATHRRLEELARERQLELEDPSVGVWALEVLAERAPLSSELTELLQRLQARVEPLELPADDAWASLALPELRRLLDALAKRPGQAAQYERALVEMSERDTGNLRWVRRREKLLWSLGREAEVQALWRGELEKGRLEPSACRLGILRSLGRTGLDDKVLLLMAEGHTSPVLEEAAQYAATAGELGSDAERVQALGLLAECAKPAVAAVLFAYVSGLWLRRGSNDQALEAAERACRADSQSARAFVTCAEALADAETRVAALVFERASRMALPRVAWCRNLAKIAELHGNSTQRLKWLRRWASLSPLDTQAASALLSELGKGDDASAIEAALDWLLGQPRPRQELLISVCEATTRLAELDAAAVNGFARRLIGVFGLADERLVQTLKNIAVLTHDPALAVAVVERQLVFAAGAREQIALLYEAAERRAEANEIELAVDCLARAHDLGAPVDELVSRLDGLPERTSSDAYLQELAIRVAAGRQASNPDIAAQIELELELALGYRDLASDKAQALAVLTPPSFAVGADDATEWFCNWVEVFGYPEAASHLRAQVQAQPAAVRLVWLRAACLRALEDGQPAVAVELAFGALEASPLQTDVLSVLETALSPELTEELERAYQIVQPALLGVYGERAMHYRAACELERRGDRQRALAHAEAAFLAMPGHGIAFALMSRLAQALGRPERVGEVMRQASEAAPDTAQRKYWLEHASSVAKDRVVELRERLDVLLRALAVRADADAIRQVAHVCAEIFEHAPELREELAGRFDAAIRALLRTLDGSLGATIAMAAAAAAQAPFGNPELSARYLALAVESDPTNAELGAWASVGPSLTPFQSRALLEAVTRVFEAGRPIHVKLLELCRKLAEGGERHVLAPILVALAVAEPQNVELLATARKAVGSDATLLRRLEEAVPPLERALAILRDVDTADGAAEQAVRLDASVRRLASRTEWFAPVFERLRQLASDADAQRQVEATLEYLVNQEDIAVAQRAEAARLWAELLAKRDSYVAALDVLGRLIQWRQMTAADQRWGADVARLAGDEEQELGFLGQLELHDATDGNSSSVQRVAVLSRIAELHAAMGSRMQAKHYYEKVLVLAPGHETAERFLLEDAERSEDYTALAARLEEQLVVTHGEPAIAVKLSQVYSQRLAAPERAKAALESALRLYGDDEELLCALGAMLDSMGEHASAAAVYQKASRGSRQHHRASLYAELACRSYLRAGMDDSVREILAVKGLYPNTQALAEMRVELARKRGRDEELIVALEELSVVSKEPAAERVKFLHEASEIALERLGDLDRALALAERGARMAPSHVPLQLFARMLQYRKRGGVGSRQEALYTITELRSMPPASGDEPASGRGPSTWSSPEQAEIRAFLLAEALSKRSGGNNGLKELRDVEAQYGALPLVDLAIGERLSGSDVAEDRQAAIAYFERALTGDFRGLRSRDQVALDAAVLALKSGQPERARALAAQVDPRGEFGSSAAELLGSVGMTSLPATKKLGESAPVFTRSGTMAVARVALKQVPATRAGMTPAQESNAAIANIADTVRRAPLVPSASNVTAEMSEVTPGNPTPLVEAPPVSSETTVPGLALADAILRARAMASSPPSEETGVATEQRDVDPALDAPSPTESSQTHDEAPAPELELGVVSDSTREFVADVVAGATSARPTSDSEPESEPASSKRAVPSVPEHAEPEHALAGEDVHAAHAPAVEETNVDVDVVEHSSSDPRSSTARDAAPDADVNDETTRDEARAETQVAASSDVPPLPALSQQAIDPFAAAKGELERLESQPPTTSISRPPSTVGRGAPPPKPSRRSLAAPLQVKAPPKRKPEPQSPSVVVSRSVVIGPDPRTGAANPLSQPPPSAQRSLAPNSEIERGLMTALTAGSVGAGRELLGMLRKDGSRTRETLAACRLLAHWAPGDEQILAQTREAALKDNDPVYARALLHVQRVLREPARSPGPPPLHRQSEHVESMIKLLAGPIQAGCEALGLLWQQVPDLFRQDPPDPLAERKVDLSAGNPLGELVFELGRLFGCARVGVYETGQPGPLEFELVLAQPAALVIHGDVNPDSPHFRYHLGRMLFATRPEYALIVGLEPDELRTVLGAVAVGFGPPRRLSGDVSHIAHLAERFWELLPPHTQRRLGELCEHPQVLEADLVQEGARRALCRAGLFACGDLGVAMREVAAAEGLVLERKGLRELCEESEAVADLVRFATSLEYADARWRSGTSRSSAEELGVRAR